MMYTYKDIQELIQVRVLSGMLILVNDFPSTEKLSWTFKDQGEPRS